VKDKRKQAKEQMKFCKELMNRLVKSIDENIDENSSWCVIRNHSQISNDIVRLRRELNVLNKLMYPYN
jgi:diadenosine tetraphosphatase ApaH/serine/threonine PP2A family protein phosphatase